MTATAEHEETVIDVRSLADWAVAELDAVATEVGHCYDCGSPRCLYEARAVSAHAPHPWPLGQWANITAGRIEWEQLGTTASRWNASQVAMVRALAEHMLHDADYAERFRS